MSGPQPSDTEPIATRRSRREKKKTGASSALEKIKRSRESGVREESELEAPDDVYEYVDESEYARIVQQRQEEGFILDDDGSYCEHGREVFDEEVEPAPLEKEGGPKKTVPKRVARPASSVNIKSMLMGRGDAGRVKKRKKEESVSVKDDDVLSDILLQMDHPRPSSSAGAAGRRVKSAPMSAVPHPPPTFAPRTSSMYKKVKVVKSEERSTPAKPHPPSPPPPQFDDAGDCGVGEWEGVEDDGGGGVGGDGGGGVGDDGGGGVGDDGGGGVGMKEEVMVVESEEPKPAVPEEAVSSSGWETVRGELQHTLETLSSVQVESSSLPTREVDGVETLHFFWLDAFEDPYHQPGTAYLFGKVWVENVGMHVSCCVAVKNIERCLYFLPREKVHGTDQEVTMEDVYREFNDFATSVKLMRFSSKRVSRKYAFEKPDIPQESEYLQVRYSAECRATPNASGQTYSHTFGAHTSSLERLILNCRLKGPSWLHISYPQCPPQCVSWCKVECVVQSMDHVTVAKEQALPPPLVVMSLNIKSILNPKTRNNEVLCVGALIHPGVGVDKPPPKPPFEADFCTIRRPVDRDFPFGFEEFVKKKGFNIEVTPSERALLAYILAKVHRVDPDVIVGHGLSSLGLALLQHRLAACKVPQWSRIGRLRRREMPKGRFAGQLLSAGRPLCDIRTSAQELIRARSYDITELANTLLHAKHAPMEQEDIMRAFGNCDQLSRVIAHTMDEAMLSLRLMYELNALPLAYQITCIAGNTLSRTLAGGRAERNEFLLLHAFTAREYMCPDKLPPGKRAHHQTEEGEEEAPSGAGRGRRKPAYSGGLVLEPKKGFYDRFILLLDFNSLYPSIIQEYNICFTTVDHAHCSLDAEGGYSGLHLPELSEEPGVLPSEIRVLVERRRQVKQLMKASHGSPEQYTQYDIRQKALKLTANSMYGCLGFTNSRFYAKPLAALITGKGREILARTKELAQQMNLDVIYGDTDSIMIDSNTRNLEEAERLAQRVKAEVNKLYRLLEIDVDGIFKSMLLLKKKKYAAVAIERKDGHLVERRELKGLDIVRRDWCGLAKMTGHFVLDQILSGASLDDVIEKIQGYLQKVQQDVVSGQIPLEQFVITKSLSKAPADYPDKRGLAHVQVALRMLSRNQHVQPGDVIPYVMCQGESSQPAAQRAYHPSELSRQDHLQVDTGYYLQHQVHAVVSRLCEPIEGLDAAGIAECLGLDPSGFRSSPAHHEEEGGEGVLLGLVGGRGEEKESWKDVCPLHVRCPHCGCSSEVKRSQGDGCRGEVLCSECRQPLREATIINHLTLAARACCRKYYAGWLVCEDQACRHRTRSVSIVLEESQPRCSVCRQGRLKEEFPAAALYRQLAYFEHLFAMKDDPGECGRLKAHVRDSLTLNQYSRVSLARLFPNLS